MKATTQRHARSHADGVDDNDAEGSHSPGTAKRRKCEMMPAYSIRAVLADELTQPVPVEPVVCATLAQQADISRVMRALVQHMPMQRLQHLKRVHRDRRIILFAPRDLLAEHAAGGIDDPALRDIRTDFADALTADELTTIARAYLRNKGIADAVIELVCRLPVAVHSSVATVAPPLRWQYDIAQALWPCKFHPNQAAEILHENRAFDAAQTARHLQNMRIALSIGRQCDGGRPAGVAVDPRTGSIVAVGVAQDADVHPLMHSAMCMIDAVARSQCAGAWNAWPLATVDAAAEPPVAVDAAADSVSMAGVPSRWRIAIQREFPNVPIGAQSIRKQPQQQQCEAGGNESLEAAADAAAGVDNLAKYGPYLCTGYDVYLTEEPCMLCAMALVHSRVRTVFYHRAQANGALGSLAKLHAVTALNHHYDVFRVCE